MIGCKRTARRGPQVSPKRESTVIGLKRELAEARAERDEAFVQQAAVAEVLQVINSSPGELGPVFDAMLEKALALCDAACGHMLTYDGESFTAVAARGPAAIVDFFRDRPPTRPAPGTTMYRLLQGERFAQVADSAGEVSGRGNPTRQALVDLAGARSGVSVGLRKDGSLLGAISLYRQEVRPFSDKQIALLQNFAAQAVIAMENARLLGELRHRTRDLEESLQYQTATSEVLQVISRSTFDLQPVLDTVVETAARLCNADLSFIVSREGEVYRRVASFSVSPEWDDLLREQKFTPDRGTLIGRAVLQRRAVHVAEIAADPEHTHPEAVTVGKARTSLSVPLLREGEPIGVICLGRQRVEPFTERQIELVRTFADQAVIAIGNTRLINETREALDQQTATAEVLQVINASPGDLSPVFDAMIRKAVPLCGAAQGSLRIFDGEALHLAAWHGDPRFVDRARELGPIVPRPGHPMEPLLRGERVIHLADAKEAAAESRDLAVH